MDIKISMETSFQLMELANKMGIEFELLVNHIVEPDKNPLPCEFTEM